MRKTGFLRHICTHKQASPPSGACPGARPLGHESSAGALARNPRGGHLELLLLEHVGVRRAENVICQLRLAVNVDWSGGFAAQELTENFTGPVGKLTGHV